MKTGLNYQYVLRSLVVASETNPRKHFAEDELEALVESVREHGVLQPLLVRPVEGGKYEIVAGERRWRAAGQVGLEQVPVMIRELSDVQMAEMQMVENIERAKLDPMEESYGVRRLIELGRSPEQVSKALKRCADWVQLRFDLGDLPELAQSALREKRLGIEGAAQVLKLEKEVREHAVQDLMDLGEKLTASDVRQLLHVRYHEPRARREAWKKVVAEKLADLIGVEALEDCEKAAEYLETWGEPVSPWVLSKRPIGGIAARVAEESVTWGELAAGHGFEILMVPRGDVKRGEVEFLVNSKQIRDAEAGRREAGESYTIGARNARRLRQEAVAEDSAVEGKGESEEEKVEKVVRELTLNKGAAFLVARMLDVFEPGWDRDYECPVMYLLDNLDGGDSVEDTLLILLGDFFGVREVKEGVSA